MCTSEEGTPKVLISLSFSLSLSLSLPPSLSHLLEMMSLKSLQEDDPTLMHPLKDAFSVLMSAQQQLKLPAKISPESALKNSKFQLRNAIIEWLDTNKLGWSATIVESHGRNFISLLCDVLWNLDGHHGTLRSRSCGIPVMFSGFVGYNQPQKRKGRKRGADSLSQAVLDLQSLTPKQSSYCVITLNFMFHCLLSSHSFVKKSRYFIIYVTTGIIVSAGYVVN